MSVRSSRRSARTWIPTETAPTIRPPSRSGTFARAERPRVPVSTASTVPPRSAAPGSVLTRWPMRRGSGWETRIPRASVTTTNVVPVARRIASARRCTSPPSSPRATARAISGVDATERATSSARASYWSSSRDWVPASARTKPTASVPTRISSWKARI